MEQLNSSRKVSPKSSPDEQRKGGNGAISIFQAIQEGQALKPRFQFPHGGLPSVGESTSTAEMKGK
jgi:hypothetical protein